MMCGTSADQGCEPSETTGDEVIDSLFVTMLLDKLDAMLDQVTLSTMYA